MTPGRNKSGELILRPIRPNLGIEVEYRRRLHVVVDEMARSYYRWLRAVYRANPPAIASDALPAKELRRELERLGTRWEERFLEAAPALADWFATAAEQRSTAVLKKILRDGGFSVKFKMTRAMRDVLAATNAENVSLIKSIPAQFHTQVEGMVMRSVTAGRDLATMTRDLQHNFGVTRRRAELISLHQNNMATASMTRARQDEIGIEEAVWRHSHAKREPRPTHLANDGNRYKVREGWFDPDPKVRRRIWPGELIRCGCVSQPVVKGFS